MRDLKWLIEKRAFQDDFCDRLTNHLQKNDTCFKITENEYHSQQIFDQFPPEDCVIFYGSLGLARSILKKTTWIPGVYYNFDHFKCSYYYPILKDILVNYDYIFLPFSDLYQKKKIIFNLIGEDIFIRPDSGGKIFTGFCSNLSTLDNDLNILRETSDIKPETMCLVSSRKDILKEWRLVVSKKGIITGSLYLKQGTDKELKEDHHRCSARELKMFTNIISDLLKRVNEWDMIYNSCSLDPVFTVDICQQKDLSLRILECNSFSCAGLYDCDEKKIVKSVSSIAKEECIKYFSDLQI